MTMNTVARRDGSSPLTRGKPRELCIEKIAQGLIPAHAGKTPSPITGASSTGAHPRSRGENRGWGGGPACDLGSSPLTRGKRPDPCVARVRRGLIPAHAGKTRDSVRGLLDLRAHPRSRGENVASVASVASVAGSSPLTRGKLCRDRIPKEAYGLIPAHAGKTVDRAQRRETLRAHPRSRGENNGKNAALEIREGSSPLTRGKHRAEATERRERGLIPAHAGKTRCIGED